MEEAIRKLRQRLEEVIERYGLQHSETIKWSELFNKLLNIDYKLKEIDKLKNIQNKKS
ncbi:MAG: Spo0E family sporulation regulatory protein-aspartic acid phosphatase, partial [Clostridia bacterium]|nr:Spo0E family sporulation regulatory protein-aspartic acid phosphatase [Clostridia bacterium]